MVSPRAAISASRRSAHSHCQTRKRAAATKRGTPSMHSGHCKEQFLSFPKPQPTQHNKQILANRNRSPSEKLRHDIDELRSGNMALLEVLTSGGYLNHRPRIESDAEGAVENAELRFVK